MDATKGVLLSSEEFVLFSMIASEMNLLYVLHVKGLRLEDWLSGVPAFEKREIARREVQLLELLHDLG